MAAHYGATPQAWEFWRSVAEDDLLPVVSNPDAQIDELSKMAALGKTPSRYSPARTVVGIPKWTGYMPSDNELRLWAKEPDYGICVQTRGAVKAIDVDVPDPIRSRNIRDCVFDILGGEYPVRERGDSGKLLIPLLHSEPLTKRVLDVEGGIIEFLAVGQQFVAEGTHPDGERYRWTRPMLLPEVTSEQLEQLFATLEMVYGLKEWKIARERREGAGGDLAVIDDVAGWLVENWETYGEGPGGQINIKCPFSGDHTGPSSESSTSYFPAGTGGYAQGHFVCLHAHCSGRDDRDYLDRLGYGAAQFADLVAVPSDRGDVGGEEPADDEALLLVRDSKGRIEATADNLVKLCSRPDKIGKILAFDEFRDELVWAPATQRRGEEQWRAFSDIDYVDVRIELERRGMKPVSQDMLRQTIKRAAWDRHMDTAQEWLGRLQWDGVERIDGFCIAAWGWAATDYSRAVGRYLWTALAGRVLEPGCQADMAPILVGPQGQGKTSAIRAMAPSEEHYVSIPLDDHDNDTSRRLRGKLVGELEELRGLNSRAIEVIKAWITRRVEGWIPKYMEFESTFKRRLVFIGSTNEDEFLADPTGERRWLPGRCGELDVQWIIDNRDQLWAEGAAKFRLGGVDWEDAQRLAQDEHHDFKVTDSWEGAVERWLLEKQISGVAPVEVGHVMVADVLSGAIGIPTAGHDRAKEMRMVKVLKGLGWARRRLKLDDGSRPWAYVKQ